jgi:hypothetical protein
MLEAPLGDVRKALPLQRVQGAIVPLGPNVPGWHSEHMLPARLGLAPNPGGHPTTGI